MASKKIVYLCNYDHKDSGTELLTQPSSNSKISYILQSLLEADYNIDIISTAIPVSNGYYKSRTLNYGNFSVRYFSSFGHKSLFCRVLSTILVYCQIVWVWLLNRDTMFLVYHSPKLTRLLKFCTLLGKRNKIYLEIEEIFSVVRHQKYKEVENEIKLIGFADGYICVNEHIKDLCNLNGRCAVCHGEYLPKNRKTNTITPQDVRIVYAGGLDNDALLAIQVARLLPKNFHLYILGYGSEKQVKTVKAQLSNSNIECAQIELVGRMEGDEYRRFLAGCNIGLSPRVVDSDDSLYAFPSKILAYLSSNLLTVSTPLRSIKESELSSLVHFSDDFSAEALARIIIKECQEELEVSYNSILCGLHEDFVNNLRVLLKN